jgi:acetyl-CoA C-acetyltransferase
MNSSARRVAVLGGIRIPFARQNGPYARASNQDMMTATLEALISNFELEGEALGEVSAGGVLKHSRDFNLTRECVLGTRLDPHTPAYDIQQACRSRSTRIFARCCSRSTGPRATPPG